MLRDTSINVLYYDITLPATHEAVMDEIALSYQTLQPWAQTSYADLRIKAYDEGGGPPKETKTYPFGGTGGLCPNEVAVCLSYSAADDSGGRPRFRGRIYLPITGDDEIVSPAKVDAVLDFGELLAAVGLAGQVTWMMRSALGTGSPTSPQPVFRKIESVSCDNAWDTQRRRGLRATYRLRRDVQ